MLRIAPVLQRLGVELLPLVVHPLRHERDWQRKEVAPLQLGVDLLPTGCDSRIPEALLLRHGSESQRLDLGRG